MNIMLNGAKYLFVTRFFGVHTTLFKGFIRGEKSIIGTYSMVTKAISCNEILWGSSTKYLGKTT